MFLDVVANVVDVVKSHWGVFKGHLESVRSHGPVGKAQHGVCGQAGNQVERPQGFSHTIDTEGERQPIDPFQGIVLDANVECGGFVLQGQWCVKPN